MTRTRPPLTRWLARLGAGALVVAAALLGAALAPAAATAGTLTTGPAQNVEATSATFEATTSGYTAGSNGSGDYCSFIYWQTDQDPATSFSPVGAVPCTSSYSIPVSGLTPGQSYAYAATHCDGVTQASPGVYYCNENNSTNPPSFWDQTDPCFPSGACPDFRTPLPTGTTKAATGVFGTSATLNATIDTKGADPSAVSYSFQYSTDPSLGGASQTQPTAANTQPGSSSGCPTTDSCYTTITGLVPDTTYYFRVVVKDVESQFGPTYGSILSFRTGGFAITDPATAVTAGGAQLNGEVSAGDTSLSYYWVYSTSSATNSDGLLDSATAATATATVAAGHDQLVSTSVGSLSPATTYYFQLQTSDPLIHGQVLSFSTAAPCGYSVFSNHLLPGTGFLISGCFAVSGSRYTAHGTVQINGLTFSGAPTSTLTIDTADEEITTSGSYQLQIGDILLKKSATLTFNYVTSVANGVTRSTVQVLPDPSAAWYGLPLLGTVTITARSSGGSELTLAALGIPALFGGVTAAGSADLAQDGTLSDLHAQILQAMLGPLELPTISLDYDAASASWKGSAILYLPFASAGAGATVAIKHDQLTELMVSCCGVDIPLGDTGVSLDNFSLDAVFNPFSLSGAVDLGFGPEIAGTKLFDINAGYTLALEQDQTLTGIPGVQDGTVLRDVPLTLSTTGQLNLFGFIDLANSSVSFYATPDPFVSMAVSVGPGLTIACAGSGKLGVIPQGGLSGDFLVTNQGPQFNLAGSGSFELYTCTSTGVKVDDAQFEISSAGVAACGSVLGNALGAGYRWPSITSSFPTLSQIAHQLIDGIFRGASCDLSPYEQWIAFPLQNLGGAMRRAVAPAPRTLASRPLRLPSGLRSVVIRVVGRGALPTITLVGPDGLRIASSAGVHAVRDHYLLLPVAATHTVFIELEHPRGGRYQLLLAPGSAPVAAVSVAHGLPAPALWGRLSGRGLARTLRWRARPLPAQRIALYEIGAAGARLLLETGRTHGTLRFRPTQGAGSRGFIVADIYERGLLSRVVRVASFRAPILARPLRPSRIRSRLRRRTLTVSWRAAGAVRYLVLVRKPDGSRRLYITRRPRLVLRGLPRGWITVTITGENLLDQRGPSARARLRG